MFFQLGLWCKKDCLFLNVFTPLKGKTWSFSRDGGMGYFQLSWGSMNCDSLSTLNVIEKSQDQANLSAILKLFIFLSVQLSFCFLQNVFPLQNSGINNFP